MLRLLLSCVLAFLVSGVYSYNILGGDIFSKLRFGSDKEEEALAKFVSNFKKAKGTGPVKKSDGQTLASNIVLNYAKTLTQGIGANDKLMKNLHNSLTGSGNIHDGLNPPTIDDEEKPINSLGKAVVNILKLQEISPKNYKKTNTRRSVTKHTNTIKDFPIKQCYIKDNVNYCLNFKKESHLQSFRNKAFGRVKANSFQDYQELLLASKEDYDLVYREKKLCYKLKKDIFCTRNMKDMFI